MITMHYRASSRTVLHRSGGNRIRPLPMMALALLLLLPVSLPNAAAAATTTLPQLPPRSQVLDDGLRAANYWLNATGGQQSCRWEDATFMLGLSRLQNATGSPELLAREVAYGEQHNWDLCEGHVLNPDFQACAATYLEAYMASPPEAKNATWLSAVRAQYDREVAAARAAVSRGASPAVHWSWVDALFMAVSVYARLGAATGEQAYFDFMHRNFDFAALGGYALWSPPDALFYRDPPGADTRGAFWARGNGWALGALAAALDFTPRADPHRAVYADLLQRHAARLAQLQGADGCWRVSLTDPNFNPTPETTGTAMFAYGMAYGVRTGLLARGAYEPVVARAWQCLTTKALQPSGRVGFCQPGGDRPNPTNTRRESTSSFCVGQVLLAASEVAQLAGEAATTTTAPR